MTVPAAFFSIFTPKPPKEASDHKGMGNPSQVENDSNKEATKASSTTTSPSSSIPMITPAKPSESSSNSSNKMNTVTPYSGDIATSSSSDTPAAATPRTTSLAPAASAAATSSLPSIENYVFGDDYRLPPLIVPPQSEMEPVETFVMNAVASQHIDKNNNEEDEESGSKNAATKAATIQGYKAIIDNIRGRGAEDPEMLYKVLIALRTAGHGKTIRQITSYPEIHAHLNHCIFKLNSVHPPSKYFAVTDPDNIEDKTTMELYQNYYVNGKLLDAHIHLLLAIVSARSVSVVPALTWAWKMIPFQPEDPIMYRLHAYLFQLLRLIPKARTDIFSVIASCAPYWTRDKCHLDFYFLQCIRVINYLPAIRKSILELIIDKCLEIDIHIHIQDNGNVLIEKDNEKDKGGEVEALPLSDVHLSQGDPATTTSATAENATMKPKEYEKVEYPSEVAELSDKLDSSLALILETIQKECHKHTNNDQQQRLHSIRQLYDEVYPIFESTILTTHKAKFVQYCMFLLCGLEAEQQQQQMEGVVDRVNIIDNDKNGNPPQHEPLYCDFTSKLIAIVTDPYRATLTRQSGACYLASFISRASYVCPNTVCHSVSSLLTWAEKYIAGGGGTGGNDIYAFRAADTRQQTELHSLFYTVCQAVFYIMCFRGAEAIKFTRKSNNDEVDIDPTNQLDVVDVGKQRWTRICNHPLKPLRYCLESVRSEFLHLAHAFDLIDEQVFNRLVTDAKRMSTGLLKKRKTGISTPATLEKKRQEGGVGGLGKGSNPLKSFFPFDPLLLSRSHVFIEPCYNEWQGPVEEEDVLEIDESDNDSLVSSLGVPRDFEEERHDGGAFAMDEDDVDGCDNDDDDDGDDTEHKEEDDEESDDDDDDFGSNHDRRDLFGENPDPMFTTPDTAARKEEQRWAWTEITKRKRSQSMSSTGGSW